MGSIRHTLELYTARPLHLGHVASGTFDVLWRALALVGLFIFVLRSLHGLVRGVSRVTRVLPGMVRGGPGAAPVLGGPTAPANAPEER